MLRLLSRPVVNLRVHHPAIQITSSSPHLKKLVGMAASNTPAFVCFLPFHFPFAANICIQQNEVLYAPLSEVDPEVQNIIDKEIWRQFTGLELIASEVSSPLLTLKPQ